MESHVKLTEKGELPAPSTHLHPHIDTSVHNFLIEACVCWQNSLRMDLATPHFTTASSPKSQERAAATVREKWNGLFTVLCSRRLGVFLLPVVGSVCVEAPQAETIRHVPARAHELLRHENTPCAKAGIFFWWRHPHAFVQALWVSAPLLNHLRTD